MFDKKTPSIVHGLRGLSYLQVDVRGTTRATSRKHQTDAGTPGIALQRGFLRVRQRGDYQGKGRQQGRGPSRFLVRCHRGKDRRSWR